LAVGQEGFLMASNVVRVLQADPDLGASLAPVQRAVATGHLRAAELSVEGPTWRAGAPPGRGHLGLLLLEGLLVRQVTVHGCSAWEPLGPGDVLQPWEDDTAQGILEVDSTYTVLVPARLADLDARFAARLAHWPALIAAYGARLTRRSCCLVDLWAIGHQRRVAERVHLLLWFFADRWGQMTPQGLVVPFALTHGWIARFVGARRPSATSALNDLRHEGVLSRHLPTRGWIIHQAPQHTDQLHDPQTPARVGVRAA